MKHTVVYLHGLNSSGLSFKYVQSKLPAHNVVNVNYQSHQPLAQSIVEVLNQIPKNTPISVVGHSLGGLIATLIAPKFPGHIKNLITISAPLGGSKAANVVRWLPGHPQVMADIATSSGFINQLRDQKEPVCPVLNIVSTGGHLNSSSEPNDSVVTIASQCALPFGSKEQVFANHFEVLMHDDTIRLIKDQIFKD